MRRGDLVILDHPYSDASGAKVRPALVVQNDRDNARPANTIVALVTRNTSREGEPTHLPIDLATDEVRRTGLRRTSAVVFNSLFTVSQAKVLRVIGRLPPALLARVDDCLKAALDLR